ncbi:MAG: aldo/keto reductase [Rhodospirillaceae bacterium]|jgi:aryl-alcohol dehydrogenase-like predicted oxidoreductase|nr:aldo/keto reductase [Rhodospirillaceae bacterium]MBT5943289.1 aldo/keto reductase [Rhodospirillaceae bacterium]MBT6404801.1 aldo/keto reductase [Rhodospirillaceae bacterium]MBT6536756.1 aldo/keto reductase [Rhodospirillaceae bacterium]MBT7362642.1 aldo/keto reductase [Rhodospirillaceae bacterium]
MQYRHVGNSGLKVSLIGLGCNNFGARMTTEDARPIVHKALDLGVTLFDTADSYGSGGSESALGDILGSQRQDIVLASKFGLSLEDSPRRVVPATRDYIMDAVEGSLRRLQTDWIDLYQLHALHAETAMDEVLRALDDLVTQGKVRHVGCSNLSAWRVVDADWGAETQGLTSFVSSQNEYNLLNRGVEKELLPALREKKMGFLPFYPLAAGVLTGKYHKGGAIPAGTRLDKMDHLVARFFNDETMDIVEALRDFADARGRTLLELSFAWLASRDVIPSIIAGTSRPEQVEANVAAVEWQLTDDEVDEIDRISTLSSDARFGSLFRN